MATFGTSGLRGLVQDLTPDLVGSTTRAFIATCDTGRAIWLGRDLRPSSPAIADMVARAACGMGVDVIRCGALPTPALAYAAAQAGGSAIMITGSHIPADRNGIKFYATSGEITKEDEAAITAARPTPPGPGGGTESTDRSATMRYAARYRDAFAGALRGQRIGVYTHSAVGRDLLMQILSDLGAQVVELGRSDKFTALDTEAIPDALRQQIAGWVGEHGLDALVSTDGDSDRPLLADEQGHIVPGDILGQITARALGADTIVTPVSSGSGIDTAGAPVIRTRIGSPHVIAAMARGSGRVLGYEPNGGILLGYSVRRLAPLVTRDAVLPLIATLAQPGPVSQSVAREPAVRMLADRVPDVDPARSAALIAALRRDPDALLRDLGMTCAMRDETDGLRMTGQDGRIVHLRPSGNAPELRIYVEAATEADARALLTRALTATRAALA